MAERLSDGRDKAAVGERLRLTREALGLQQKDFASGAELATNTYNQYEKAKNLPDLRSAHALCDRYKLTLDWIYRGDASGLQYNLAEAIKALRSVRR